MLIALFFHLWTSVFLNQCMSWNHVAHVAFSVKVQEGSRRVRASRMLPWAQKANPGTPQAIAQRPGLCWPQASGKEVGGAGLPLGMSQTQEACLTPFSQPPLWIVSPSPQSPNQNSPPLLTSCPEFLLLTSHPQRCGPQALSLPLPLPPSWLPCTQASPSTHSLLTTREVCWFHQVCAPLAIWLCLSPCQEVESISSLWICLNYS